MLPFGIKLTKLDIFLHHSETHTKSIIPQLNIIYLNNDLSELYIFHVSLSYKLNLVIKREYKKVMNLIFFLANKILTFNH